MVKIAVRQNQPIEGLAVGTEYGVVFEVLENVGLRQLLVLGRPQIDEHRFAVRKRDKDAVAVTDVEKLNIQLGQMSPPKSCNRSSVTAVAV